MSDIDHYDFFVSYARSDNANGWISNFVEELLAEHRKFTAGRELTYFIDKEEIGAGADWQHTLNHGIAHSKLFVAFISPSYFASEWCRKEWRAWIDAEIAKHIFTAGVRPVYIVEVPGLTDGDKVSGHDFAKKIADFLNVSENDRVKLLVETPPVVKHLRRRQLTHNQPFCDVHSFYTEGIDTLRRDDLRQVLSKLAQDLDHHAELLAKAEASDSTIPPYNRHFSGRLDELLQLREWLDKDDRTGVIHGVHGLGGIGKTELAYTYAHGYASAYPGGRYIIKCEGKNSLADAIRVEHEFIQRFDDKISDEQRKDPAEYYAAILFHLGRRMEQLGHVLLLLDNVTDLSLLAPEQTDALTKLGPKLHLLATTRLPAPTTPKDSWLSLDRLPDEDAIELLEKHRPFESDEDREAAWQIVKRLDGFTLAIELTAAYLAAKESVSYAKMSEYLDIEALEKMSNKCDVKLRRHNHERSLSAILKSVLEGLQPAERRFMEYVALLPPDQVPLPWLKELVTHDFPELSEEDQLENPWNEVWQKLEKLSLISRTKEDTPEPRIFRVHRLVQELVLKKTIQIDLRQDMIEKLIEERIERLLNVTEWVDAKWELLPLERLALVWAEHKNNLALGLLNKVTIKLYELGEWVRLEPLCQLEISISEKEHGSDSTNTAACISTYAMLLKSTGRISAAEMLLKRALDIDEKVYGPNHPLVATRLNNLASLYFEDLQNYEEAENLIRRAIAIGNISLGEFHPDVTIYINSLASLLNATNRRLEAEPYMRKALAIDEHNFGNNHHRVATRLHNLAMLLIESNRFDEAEVYARKSLLIDKQCYGDEHHRISSGLNALALILRAKGELSEAESLLRSALNIDEKIYGLIHRKTAIRMSELGELLRVLKRFAEAEEYIRKALAIMEQIHGPDSQSLAIYLANLSTVLREQNKYSEAWQTIAREIDIYLIYTINNKKNHAWLVDSIASYAFVMHSQNKNTKSIITGINEIFNKRGVVFKKELMNLNLLLLLIQKCIYEQKYDEAKDYYILAISKSDSSHEDLIYLATNNLINVFASNKEINECSEVLVHYIQFLSNTVKNDELIKNKTAHLINRLKESQGNSAIKQAKKHAPAHVDKVGRNDPCPCGSGKKYKKCCGA